MVHEPLNPTSDPARRTRILHVVQNLNYGGMERLLANLVRLADHQAFELHVMALEYLGRFADGLEEFANLHVSDPLPRWSMLWPEPLARQIRRIDPDIIHTHSGVWYKASLAALRAGVPNIIHTEHGRRSPDPWYGRLIDGRAARRTSLVVAVSQVLAEQLSATVVAKPTPIRVIHNGVDTESFKPRTDTGAVRNELGVPADAHVIGSIGRLEPIKGFDVMVAAFARLRRELKVGDPHLVIVGDGSESTNLKEQVQATGLRNVHFLGWRDDVHDLLASFTLFTMSSRSEGTSISLLEAMSSGLCPVVTDVGGNGAVLAAALCHRLVRPEDPTALALAWSEALNDPERLEVDSRTARDRICADFNLDSTVLSYQSMYDDLVARSPAGMARLG